MNCELFTLSPAKLVAVAHDSYLTPENPFPDSAYLPDVPDPMYGQDLTFGVSRTSPGGQDVGNTEAILKPKMQKLVSIFASNDTNGMTQRLFSKFLAKQSSVSYFEDMPLNNAAKVHPNIVFFLNAALSAPDGPARTPGKIRIHQALKQANWDINKLKVPTDLGVPAFNQGSKVFRTGDFSNGLGLMINGEQHVYIYALAYNYDEKEQKYCIKLRYLFYDVFGLDDTDLQRFGSKSDGALVSNASIGITAWWQLQHQFGYAPLVTRIILEKTFEVPAT